MGDLKQHVNTGKPKLGLQIILGLWHNQVANIRLHVSRQYNAAEKCVYETWQSVGNNVLFSSLFLSKTYQQSWIIICRSIFYEEANICFSSNPQLRSIEAMSWLTHIGYVWFLEKSEIRDLLFKNCKYRNSTFDRESVIEFCIVWLQNNGKLFSSPLYMMECTLLRLFLTSGKHGMRSASSCRDIVTIVEKIFLLIVPAW